MELCVFTKHFQNLDARALGKTLAGLGVDGADLTVRPKGHVEPAKVREDLPRFRDELAGQGIKITMLTTGIVDPQSPETRAIIETAGKLGIKYIKLGYWSYKGFGHLRAQEADVKKALRELEPLLRDNQVRAGFHTHSWLFMGINAGYVMRLIGECDPTVIGVYYDTGHEALEGALRGWEMDLDLAADRIIMVAVKNMGLFPMGNSNDPQNGWVWRTVPLDRGLADIGAMVTRLTSIKYNGPYSLHSEYQGQFSWRDLNPTEILEQTLRDVAYFRQLLTRNDKSG